MRYWIESTEEQRDIGLQISRWEKEGKIKIVEKGDPYQQAKEQLIKISEALLVVKEIGISQELMKMFIYSKTKIAKRDIDAVIDSQKDFLKNLSLLPTMKYCSKCGKYTNHLGTKCIEHK